MVCLNEVSNRIKQILGNNLVSLIVFGSHARGDFNQDSDIDLIIVVKSKNSKIIKRINDFENELMHKGGNWVSKKSSAFLNSIGFKKNFFLFDENEFSSKKFNFCDNSFLASLLIPKGIIWAAIKREGKVIFGSQLLDFEHKVSLIDKLKAPLPGIGACFIASLMVLFDKDEAIKLAQTGLRWTYMNVLGVLERSNIRSVFGNFKEVLRLAFKGSPYY